MRSAVYYIRNLENHRIYIGVTRSVALRIQQHLGALRCDRHINRRLQADWNAHGFDAFRWGVLEVLSSRENRTQCERRWMVFYQSRDPRYGYNFDLTKLRKAA